MISIRPLPALLCSLLLSGALLHPCALAQPAPSSLAEQYLLAAANQERLHYGLTPLHRDPQLVQAALSHAQAMALHQAISHQFSGESELTGRGASAGVRFSEISENVGEAPSVITLHQLWMNSEHHRENLLDPNVDAVGISVVQRGAELYAVEDFARSVRAVSLSQQERAIAALVANRGIAVDSSAQTVADARRTCSLDSGYVGRRPWFVMRFTSDSLATLPDELTTRLASGRYRTASVGACPAAQSSGFTAYALAVLLYP